MKRIFSRRSGALVFALLACSAAGAQDGERRNGLRAAFIAADSGQLSLEQAQRWSRDRLYPWLQATVIKRQAATLDAARVQPVLEAMGEQPASRWLRTLWLSELARREDWPSFRAAWRDTDDSKLRCQYLQARLATGAPDAGWVADAQKLWLAPDSLPTACDAPMAKLDQLGKLDEGLRWQRIDLAIPEGEAGVVRFLGKGPGAQAAPRTHRHAAYKAAPSGARI